MSHEVTAQRNAGSNGKADRDPFTANPLDSEVNLVGMPCAERLVITDRELVVFGGEGFHQRLRAWSLRNLDDMRVEPSIGSCFLQAFTGGQWVDVFRCPGPPTELDAWAEWLRMGCRLGWWRDSSGPASDNSSRLAVDVGGSERRGERGRMEGVRRIVSMMGPLRGSVLLLLGLALVAVAIDLVPPKLQGVLVDRVLQAENPQGSMEQLLSLLLAIVAGLLIIRIVATLTAIWKGYLSSRVGTSLTASLRNALVQKLTELPLAFYDKNQVGMLMSRVAYDTETLHTLIHHLTSGLLLQLFQLVGIGVMLVWINPKLALVTMLPMPLIIAGSWYFLRYLNPRHHHYWEAVGKQASALTGMLSGIRVVKAFVQEDRELERFCDCSERLRDSRQTVDVSTATFSALMGFLFTLGHLAVWYIGGRAVLFGEMSLGDLIAFFMYVAMFYAPLTSITEATTWFSTFFAASERILQVLDAPGEALEPGSPLGPHRVEGRIEFRGVSFAYQPDRPVLQDVNLTIEPGQMIGIVGRSGSGKSTLVSLIARFHEIGQGQILIDGVDLRELNTRQLRRQIGIVLQEPFLFRGPVAANIAYADVETDPEQILHAAKYADAHDFIMRMPFAYETQLGEGGSGLSGGERQRLSIARALVFEPAILILDEATASVDAQTERAIRDALARYSRGRTTIVIAHRLSTLQGADRLIVFDQGRVIEQGTHDELIARGGLYSTLVSIQMNLKENRRRVESVAAAASLGDGPFSMNEFGDEQDYLLPLDAADSEHGSGEEDDEPGDLQIHWLKPESAAIECEPQGTLRVVWEGDSYSGVYAVRAFPASHPQRYVSLRYRETPGNEIELGMINRLDTWPEPGREAVLCSLGRRHLLRPIREIRQVRTLGQRLDFSVETESGAARFQLENPGENVQAFGRRGLLLLDTQGKYYVIPDRTTLPKRQQCLLALYFGD